MRGQTELLELLLAEAIKWRKIKKKQKSLDWFQPWGICELIRGMAESSDRDLYPQRLSIEEWIELEILIFQNKPNGVEDDEYFFGRADWTSRVKFIRRILRKSKKADQLKERSADGL